MFSIGYKGFFLGNCTNFDLRKIGKQLSNEVIHYYNSYKQQIFMVRTRLRGDSHREYHQNFKISFLNVAEFFRINIFEFSSSSSKYGV